MVTFNAAASAYARVAGSAAPTPSGPSGAASAAGSDFSSLLKQAADNVVDTLQQADRQSMQAALGKADVNDVVMAVSKAELTLQTVVTVRDKAVQAYQEILRMPI